MTQHNDHEFLKRRQVGDKGESFALGYLFGKYAELGYDVKNVQHYFGEGVYRWQDKRLPDFLLTPKEGVPVLVEVKCKQGFNEYLNITCSHIKDYMWVANEKKFDLFILFFCMSDCTIYILRKEQMKKYASIGYPINNPKDSYFLYSKENLEKIDLTLPSSLFNSEILN